MVSGLVTSPCDQLRIFSGEATLILMESKSATAFPRSNGLERYKVSSCGIHDSAFGSESSGQLPVASRQLNLSLKTLEQKLELDIKFFSAASAGPVQLATGNWLLVTN